MVNFAKLWQTLKTYIIYMQTSVLPSVLVETTFNFTVHFIQNSCL
jgi:hypothetical protein